MKTIVYHLYRSLIGTFYQAHGGFFLLIIVFTFGVLSPLEHRYIMMSAIHSIMVTGWIIVAWVIYLIMVIKYNMRCLESAAYHYLDHIMLFPDHKAFFYALIVFIGQLLPVIIYACLLLFFGAFHQKWWIIGVIVTFVGGSFLVFTSLFYLKFTHRIPFTHLFHWKVFSVIRTGGFFSFLWIDVFKNQLALLFITKLSSLGLLQIIMSLYAANTYDSRLLFVGLLLVVFLHMGVVYQFFVFTFYKMSFIRGLPLKPFFYYGNLLLSFALLFLPEVSVVVRRNNELGFSWLIFPEAYLLIAGLVMGMYAELMRKPMAIRQLLRKYFFCFLLFFLGIMYHIPVLVIGICCLLFSIYQFNKHFFLLA